MSPEWVRVIRDRCHDNGIAFHFRQWGEWAPAKGHRCSDFEQFGTDPANTVRKDMGTVVAAVGNSGATPRLSSAAPRSWE